MIKAVAFDLDGTLYPNYRLYCRIFPSLLLHPRFYSAFNVIRHELHSLEETENTNSTTAEETSFYDKQASLIADYLKRNREEIRQKLERMVYRGWEKLFSGIKTFPHIKEVLTAFHTAGLKLALLSDFPPERKIVLLELDGFFDLILCSEKTGALKPSGVPFAAMARSLKLLPGEILYVGNSPRYDVEGAKKAGMKAALIRRSPFSTGQARHDGGADFVFQDYRQLREYVLK